MRARDKRTASKKGQLLMFYRLKKKKQNVRGGGGGGDGGDVRPRVKNPNGTETNQLTIYERGHGFTRVIQILIR